MRDKIVQVRGEVPAWLAMIEEERKGRREEREERGEEREREERGGTYQQTLQ